MCFTSIWPLFMFLLKDRLRQTINKKHLTKNVIGVIALNAIRHHFWYTNNPLLIDGYLKFDKLFIKTMEQHIKVKIFQEKVQILALINQSIAAVGYPNKIKEIFFK